MTESEIIKALECCCDRKTIRCIKECPLRDFDGECYTAIKCDILALLNRKNAEIEKKDKIIESYAFQYGTVRDKDGIIAEARAEAIKEFAERVKRKAKTHFPLHNEKEVYSSVRVKYIAQIAKEMGVE